MDEPAVGSVRSRAQLVWAVKIVEELGMVQEWFEKRTSRKQDAIWCPQAMGSFFGH